MNSQVPKLADDPIFVLPPYKVERVFIAASEIIDWGLEMFAIPNLWKQTKGQGIKIAVLDTGVALRHPDLVDAIEDARDFTYSPSGAERYRRTRNPRRRNYCSPSKWRWRCRCGARS
ncbi:hypothetical protein ACL6C3_09550 [Capilliphycus salinus ALCB114379]|uniref:hypothetical protein n=1 Tax=Capilliphycus salinus TaxID=2768948 RepID=UPI0039A448FE